MEVVAKDLAEQYIEDYRRMNHYHSARLFNGGNIGVVATVHTAMGTRWAVRNIDTKREYIYEHLDVALVALDEWDGRNVPIQGWILCRSTP